MAGIAIAETVGNGFPQGSADRKLHNGFCWHAGKLVVEIDGGQHAQAQQAYDERRTSWLQSQGYRVLRFWNNDVMKMPQNVGEKILRAARESTAEEPHP